MNYHPSIRAPKRILLSIPHMGGKELQYVREAFETNWLSTAGPHLTALEHEFSTLVGLPAVALANGTAALHLGMKLLGIGPGDEVVTPTLTFVASCNPILYEGGVPVFIDSERLSWNLDPNRLAEFLKERARINKLPKAVIVVHLLGQSADLDPIAQTCQHYELSILEDAAHSLDTKYKGRQVGTLGDAGIFSFAGNKVITGTSGGMLVSPRQDWTDKARFWSTQARDPDPDDLNNYVHSEVGYNYRMSNVIAGIIRGQLEVLELRIQQRREIFERYRAAFESIPGIEPQPEAQYGRPETGYRTPVAGLRSPASDLRSSSRHTRWLSCFLINEVEFGMSAADLIRFLDAANVEARPVWKPMHTQKLYQGFEYVGGEVAEDLNRRGICLPSSTIMTEEDQRFVIDRVCEAHRGGAR